MRSSKTMKRKWKETSAARPPKPAANGSSDAQGESDVYADESGSDSDDFNHRMAAIDRGDEAIRLAQKQAVLA